MKNKGFTLVELLAVLVILAALAAIIIPTTMNIIDSSKKATAIDSADGYLRAVSNYLVTVNIQNGNYGIDDEDIKADYTGLSPSAGLLKIAKNEIQEAKLCMNNYSIDYTKGTSKISENDYCNSDVKVKLIFDGRTINKDVGMGSRTTINISDMDLTNVKNVSCNNGAVPSIASNKLTVSGILGDTTCYLNNTLKNAIDNADATENNIVLLKDEENVGVSIENKKITLNMNGKKLIGPVNLIYINETGDLTINGDGLIYASSTTYSSNGAIKMHGSGNAKLTINANECNSMNPEEYQSGLLIYADANSAIANYGVKSQKDIPAELNINGGCYYSKQLDAIQVSGNTKANISNANASAYSVGIGVYGTSSITSINNNVVSSNNFAFIVNGTSTTANIEGGKYVSKAGNSATMQAQGDSILNIKNSKIRQETTSEYNAHQIGIRNEGTNKINIENVDVKSKGPAVYNNKNGIINIKSGTFESTNLAANGGIVSINTIEGATINICGGTFKTEGKNTYDLASSTNQSNDSIKFYIKYKSNGINWTNGSNPKIIGLQNHFIVDNNLTCE